MLKGRLEKQWSTGLIHPWSLVIVLLVLGLFLRFVNLDQKIYWGDEIHTSIRISGYTLEEAHQQLQTGEVISLSDLQKFQYPDPQKNASDVIHSIAAENSQHVPLYYVASRWWTQWFGNSVAVVRSLSLVISLFVFPCLYWLCWELFQSPPVSWLALAIVAISPFHILYAQEARPYSLMTVATLLSSAALLRAIRVNTKPSWGVYTATLILGLYTHLLFSLVCISHAIYIAVIERFRLRKTLLSYLAASLLALAFLIPWLIVVITSPPRSGSLDWANSTNTLFSAVVKWAGIISRAFIDVGIGPSDSKSALLLISVPIAAILGLVIYSLYFLYRRAAERAWLFVFSLIGVTLLALLLPDLLLGKYVGTTRYIIPCVLGFQISVAYLLATQMASPASQHRQIWRLITALLITTGVFSSVLGSQATVWWNKAPHLNQEIPQVAKVINTAERPLVVSDKVLVRLQILGHQLDPKVKFQLVSKSTVPDIAPGFSDVFLFEPSEALRTELQRKYKAEAKPVVKTLWRLDNSGISG